MGLIVLAAFLAGLAYSAAPGAINAEAIRRALAHGFGAALLFQIGALAGDVVWAAIALSGVVVLRLCAGLQLVLALCGAVLLVWLGWGAVRDSRRGHAGLAVGSAPQADLLVGLLLSLANPFAIVFWLSVVGGLLSTGALRPHPLTLTTAVGAFIIANLLWSVLLAVAASYGRRLVTATICRWLSAAAGVCLALFGIGLLWQTLAAPSNTTCHQPIASLALVPRYVPSNEWVLAR